MSHHQSIEQFINTQTALSPEGYQAWYRQSIEQPDHFWAERARELIDWVTPWHTVSQWSFDPPSIKWFEGGELNVSANCLDRHLQHQADKTAIIWQGDDPAQTKHISYRQLHEAVCRCANGLKSLGVKRGDRVAVYLPMIPELAITMLACARIGAVHSVVFGGFSAEALRGRILDAGCRVLVTADEGVRGGRTIPLKQWADEACRDTDITAKLVVRRTGANVEWQPIDHDYHDLIATMDTDCAAELMAAEDPLFILYTSGSTGQPKGVVHSSGGYLLYAAMTHRYIFDLQPDDIYWCTADLGWITGHSYVVYGPLANGATTVMFEGVPTWPDSSRCWQIVDHHKVTIFYTAPTAIRALMAEGNQPLANTSRQSLRLLGSVGEPINPEAWHWYYDQVGQKRCPVVDTWWQTETGGIMIAPIASAMPLKPGSASRPFFGIQPVLLDDQGQEITADSGGQGALVIKASWPGQMRGVYGDPERFHQNYFALYPGYYCTGDGASRDSQQDYRISGRLDDVLNISGHRLGTAEIESALVLHPQVAEAAVVGVEHAVKGQAIYAYVTLMKGVAINDELHAELRQWVRREIGAIATPETIQWAEALPKTRSGKIMRRILRKIANGDHKQLGDISTLADSQVIGDLITKRGV